MLAEGIEIKLYRAAIGSADFLIGKVNGDRRIAAAVSIIQKLL